MGWIFFLVLFWLALATGLLALFYWRELKRLWQEPVLTQPVLIIESDDWGAGPLAQAAALERVAARLSAYRDHAGRAPVMTLGVVLAIADGVKIERDQFSTYYPIALGDAGMRPIVDAMQAGVAQGVFALQLHGMEHYWPATLMSAAQSSEAVRDWVRHSPNSWTEALPSPLQSRWTNAATLPSTPLPDEAIDAAVRAEVEQFAAVFGAPPRVVVPPTFVWDARVERAWASAGVDIIVTPGRRFELRDAAGKPVPRDSTRISNGNVSSTGIRYIVRDAFFEPERGHRAESVAARVTHDVMLGRPTLLETHRANFVQDAEATAAAIDEMARAIEWVMRDFPNVQFLSTEALAAKLKSRDIDLVETRVGRRIAVWLARLYTVSRLRKLALVSGVAALLWAVSRVAAANS